MKTTSNSTPAWLGSSARSQKKADIAPLSLDEKVAAYWQLLMGGIFTVCVCAALYWFIGGLIATLGLPLFILLVLVL